MKVRLSTYAVVVWALLAALVIRSVEATTMTGAAPVKNLDKAHAKESRVVSEPYDYIIAGGGLAGCVLANRLTADGTKRVLVLEAGSSDYKNKFIRIPAGVLRLFRSQFDWQFESTGEPHCNGRRIFLQRGKVWGGSSCTNLGLHFRGSAQDYDRWNVPGWGAVDVLPVFKKSQKDVTGRSPEVNGKDGEWVMDDVRYQNPLSKRFLEVGVAAGLGSNPDFNDWTHSQEGVGRFTVSQNNGERCSGASAFLQPAKRRKNLVVRSGTMVKRINFDGSKTATGVSYDILGDDSYTEFEARLKPGGEVLVTGGAIGSPQILMTSGIGPATHLKEHAIDVVADLPGVGQNLQDHPAVVVAFDTPAKGVSVTSKLRIFGKTNPFPILKWFMLKSGLLTSTGCDHGAFVSTKVSDGQPDLQIRFIAARPLSPDGMKTYTQFRNTKRRLSDGYTFQLVAARAKSKGTVSLASANPHVKPIIRTNYLADPADVETLLEGIKLARNLGEHGEWKEFKGEEVFPGKDIQSKEALLDYMKSTIHTSNALVGTAKMGSGRDAVVGADLKVHGVNGVRVCDSSVFPSIPGGQTGTPTVMVAERAASFILNPEVTVEIVEEPVTMKAAA